MNTKKGITFTKRIYQSGGSLGLILPPEVCQYLKSTLDDELEIGAYEGKHGKFIAIWKKQQPKPEKRNLQ